MLLCSIERWFMALFSNAGSMGRPPESRFRNAFVQFETP